MSTNLTPPQTHALTQLRELTNTDDSDVDRLREVLESVQWDVQRAVEVIFGGGSLGSGSDTARPREPEQPFPRERERRMIKEFDIDDSEQGALLPGSNSSARPSTSNSNNSFLSILTYPFSLLSSLLRLIFNFLRIPLPNLYIPLLSRRPNFSPRGRGTPERWIRELEEETGAICLSKAAASATGLSSGIAGPSTATLRSINGSGAGEGGKHLPDFATFGTYDAFLGHLRKEAVIGCVVLVSEEHDDVAAFKLYVLFFLLPTSLLLLFYTTNKRANAHADYRNTLTNPTFIDTLTQNDIIIWGGDTRDTYAFTASLKLNVTSFPYIAFLGLQPSRSTSSSNSSSSTRGSTEPTLSILSRHQGAEACTPEKLVTHLQETLLPRVKPYLARVKTTRETLAVQRDLEESQRREERRIREEQDRAFEAAALRDRERILAKMRQEEEAKRREREEREKREREEREAEEKRKRRVGVREWLRAYLPQESGDVRVAVRLPSGTRVVRRFRKEDGVGVLYAFVDTQLHPASPSSSSALGVAAPSREGEFEKTLKGLVAQDVETKEWWGFTLATAYPRKEIPYGMVRMGELGEVGQVVVELVNGNSGRGSPNGNGSGKGKAKEKEEEEDEYETESDDE
ncbi:UBX domain-containing protein 10 [Paramarasmius palmivorus]|uniref:UBX domain-containing protein 10 n=1 Tax=Paramarasmius palmivorus TaxID=297713 RepID=A0AAW0CZU4_9AGAR